MTNRPTVFVVDDETSVLDSLTVLIHRNLHYRARTFESAADAMAAMADERPDVVLTDIAMGDKEAGIDVLKRSRELWPEVPVVLMSAVGTREAAIQAVNAGAFYFLEKPFRNKHLEELLRSAYESGNVRTQARKVAARSRHRESRRHNHPGSQRQVALSARDRLIGESSAFLEVLALIEQAARSDVTVLLTGESGTGKGVMATHLHEHSGRAGRPFLSVNCGALTETLLESQLFGHIKGAFTGADQDQPGLVRAADGGILFLDEVSELSAATQVKLLRVLQERVVIPVGGVEEHTADVRFVAATNRDLRRDVALGRFREDLYWRLNVMAIEVPPLRTREGDVRLLAEEILARLRLRDPDVPARLLDESVHQVLEAYSWPGNVRELENAIHRAAVVAGEVISVEHLPPEIQSTEAGPAGRQGSPLPVLSRHIAPLDLMERIYVEWVVGRADGDMDKAAEWLQVPTSAVRAVLARDKN